MEAVKVYLDDHRVSCLRFGRNRGLGAALDEGLRHANGKFISYLPSDDVVYADHLAPWSIAWKSGPAPSWLILGCATTITALRRGQIDGYSLQLVQVMHHRTPELGWSAQNW